MPCKENSRKSEDEYHPRGDETNPADDRSGRATEPPGTEDRQLCRCRARQQVRGRDTVLELLGVEPVAAFDAQLAQERDVRRGSSKADAAEAEPPVRDRGERDTLVGRRGSVLGHAAQLMESGE
jgi:hypothetical protein